MLPDSGPTFDWAQQIELLQHDNKYVQREIKTAEFLVL